MTRHQQLGRAIGIIIRQSVREQAMHADVDAFHAPSECHDLVSRGEDQRARQAWRHARAVSGLSRSAFRRAIRRVSQRTMDRAADRMFATYGGLT